MHFALSQFYNIYIIKKRNSSQPAEGGSARYKRVEDLEEPPVLRAQGRSGCNGLPLKGNAPLHS